MRGRIYIALVFCFLVSVLLCESAAAQWSNGKVAVSEIMRATDILRTRVEVAEEMVQLSAVNLLMSTKFCPEQSKALDRATGDDITSANAEFFECYSSKFNRAIVRYPRFGAMRGYTDLNQRYMELLSKYFGNEERAMQGYADISNSYAGLLDEYGDETSLVSAILLERSHKELADFKLQHDAIVGVVSGYSPKALLQTASGSKAVKERLAVMLHDTIVTGDQGLVRLELMDYLEKYDSGPSVIDVGPNTSLKVESFVRDSAGKSSTTMELIYGTFRAIHKQWRRGSTFSIRAGTVICGTRGTEFEMFFDPDSDTTTIMLYDGSVEIKTPYEEFLLEAGYQVTVERGYSQPIQQIVSEPPS